MKKQELLSHVRRAVDDYNMIETGDRIAVGISGGKDSLTLLVALKAMQRFYPKAYELEAITVSLGLPNFDTSPVQELCDRLEVPYTVTPTDIGEIVFDIRKESNPCSLCSKLRKGALNTAAKNRGCNKVALGHNRDDAIQTFFLSLFYEGRLHTFSPLTHLDRMDVYYIRPLLYVKEDDVRSFVKRESIQVVKSPCPVDGYTKRADMGEFIRELNKKYDHMEEKLIGAIQRHGLNGW